jgi:hypothetical protein
MTLSVLTVNYRTLYMSPHLLVKFVSCVITPTEINHDLYKEDKKLWKKSE